MKKILLIVCCIVLIALLTAGCSGKNAELPASDKTLTAPTEATTPPETSHDEDSDAAPQGVDEFVLTVDLSDKTYIAFGDSITWGYDGRADSYRMEKPYPTLVSELLGISDYRNAGISGATLTANSFGLFNQTPNICSTTAPYDIISVMMGVNDYNRSLPLGTPSDTDNGTFFGSLYMIMEHFKTHYPEAFVFFMTPFNLYLDGHDGYTNNSQGYNLADISNAIKTMANRYGFPVLDLLSDGHYELEMYSVENDGIHPSQAFFEKYTAPQIAQFINDLFDSDR